MNLIDWLTPELQSGYCRICTILRDEFAKVGSCLSYLTLADVYSMSLSRYLLTKAAEQQDNDRHSILVLVPR